MLSSAHDCSSVLFACHSRIWDESQGSEQVVVIGVCMQQVDSTCWPVMQGGELWGCTMKYLLEIRKMCLLSLLVVLHFGVAAVLCKVSLRSVS